MTFGDDKCAYQQILTGKLLQCTKNLEINQLSIKTMKEGDTYKYLGIDENISYIGPINKENYKGTLSPNKKDVEFRIIIVQ